MPRRPTVHDIGRQLGISASTVSRVLNGSQLVAEETRKRIEAVASEMGYEKRRIRRHGPRSILTVALFLPRSADVYHRLFYDPAELLAGLTEGFDSVRTQISVSVNRPQPELFESKKSGNIDACVFGFTTPSDDVRDLLEQREIPTVLLNRESPRCSFVSTDHLSGMRALLQKAAATRATVRPCYISFSPAQPVAALREESFAAACRAEGVAWSQRDLVRIDAVDQIDEAMLARIAERYNTVFCFNDFVAVYVYQVAILARIGVPEHLGIAGYDNSPVRQLTPQKIDTVSLSAYRLGREAGAWLRSAIIERNQEPIRLRVPGQVVRGATL